MYGNKMLEFSDWGIVDTGPAGRQSQGPYGVPGMSGSTLPVQRTGGSASGWDFLDPAPAAQRVAAGGASAVVPRVHQNTPDIRSLEERQRDRLLLEERERQNAASQTPPADPAINPNQALIDLINSLSQPKSSQPKSGGANAASYQSALDMARQGVRGRDEFVNQDVLNQIRGAADIDVSQRAYQDMMNRLIGSIAESEAAGRSQLDQLRGGATSQLENIMQAMEEQRARSAGQVSDIYSRAGEQIRNLENVYGGRLGGIAEEIARGAAGFGVQGGAPEGLGALSAIAQQANLRQGAAMDAAMASRAGVASGLQFDRSQEIQREYDTRMADLAQQARSARTRAELQQVQAQAEFERQRAQRQLAAAQQEDAMNQRYMEYLLGLEREQRGIMTDAGARGVRVV